MEQKQYYRAPEAAQYLGVGESTIWLYAKEAKIHPIRLSKRVTVFDINDLNRFIDQARESA